MIPATASGFVAGFLCCICLDQDELSWGRRQDVTGWVWISEEIPIIRGISRFESGGDAPQAGGDVSFYFVLP